MAGLPKRSSAITLEKALAGLFNDVWNGFGQNLRLQVKSLSDCWEKTPDHMNTLDIRSLLQVTFF